MYLHLNHFNCKQKIYVGFGNSCNFLFSMLDNIISKNELVEHAPAQIVLPLLTIEDVF